MFPDVNRSLVSDYDAVWPTDFSERFCEAHPPAPRAFGTEILVETCHAPKAHTFEIRENRIDLRFDWNAKSNEELTDMKPDARPV